MMGTYGPKHKRLTSCATRTIVFQRRKFKLFNSLYHSVYPVFSARLFSVAKLFALRYLWKTYLTEHRDK